MNPLPRRGVPLYSPWFVPVLVAVVGLLLLTDTLSWSLTLYAVLVALVVLAAVTDILRVSRFRAAWDAVPTAVVATHVDVARLVGVRHGEGELRAIRELRRWLPGVPLTTARRLVAELTGVPPGR